MSDRHADERDRKRHRKRYGPTTTNPGMRIVMRDLAQKGQDREDDPHASGVEDDEELREGGTGPEDDHDG